MTYEVQLAEPDVTEKLKGRWYQFSLWRLMIAVTLVCVVLGFALFSTAPARRQNALVRRIEGSGGRVEYAKGSADNWLTRKLRPYFPRDYFDSLHAAHLGKKATDEELKMLQQFPNLDSIWIDAGTPVSLSAIEQLDDSLPPGSPGHPKCTIYKQVEQEDRFGRQPWFIYRGPFYQDGAEPKMENGMWPSSP